MTGKQADTAGGRLEQNRIAFLHRICPAQQVGRGQPFQHQRGGLLIADALRNLDDTVGADDTAVRIGPETAAGIGDPIADRDIRNTVADGIHRAGGLQPEHHRKIHGIQPASMIDIDVIETDGALRDTNLAGPGRGGIGFDGLHDLGATGFVDLDSVGHSGLLACSVLRPSGDSRQTGIVIVATGESWSQPRFSAKQAMVRSLACVAASAS